MGFRFTCFPDLVVANLKGQIALLKELGWHALDLRKLDGKNYTQLSDAAFDAAWDTLQSNGIAVAAFTAELGNWSRPITTDFQVDVGEMQCALPRMKKTGAQIIRCMSYANNERGSAKPLLEPAAFRREVLRRLKALARMAEDAGVVLAHENCLGYGGANAERSLELLAEINSPAFKLMLDTGNGPLDFNAIHWTIEYYEKVKEHLVYFHIKAARLGADGKVVDAFPDQDPAQRHILSDLKRRGYQGWLSAYPHLCAGLLGKGEHAERAAVGIYVEYARQVEALAASA